MDFTASDPLRCPACSELVGAKAEFCAACGVRITGESRPAVTLPVVRAQHAWKAVRSAAFCYLALLAEVVVLRVVDAGERTVALSAAADLVMLLIVVVFAWPIRGTIVRLLRLPRMDPVAWALLGVGPACCWLANQAIISTTDALPGVLTSDPIAELRLAGASTGVVFLLVGVTPPLFEELAFRGVMLERIHNSFGVRPAAIVVSILFSILHLALLSFVPLAVLALVLASLRLRTGSLWPAIVGHALFNLMTLLLASRGT